VARLRSEPARVLGLPGGLVVAGAPADVTILDLGGERTIDPSRFLSRSRNTPFGGWAVTGGPWMTIVNGATVWSVADGLVRP
jgi:dihydroorotase